MPGNAWAVALTSDSRIHTLLGGKEAGRRKKQVSKVPRFDKSLV